MRKPYTLTRTPRYDPPRVYDLTRLPKLAKSGGQAWASDFARLQTQEQRAIVIRLVAQRVRYFAHRYGKPVPIILEATVKPLEGGGYELVSTAPLRPEYGGDGRTVENTKGERPRSTDNFELRMAAERIQAQLAERGVVVDEPAPDPPVVRKRKAS